MKVSVTTIPLDELDIDLLLVPVAEGAVEATLKALSEQFGEIVRRTAADFTGAPDELVWLYPESGRARRLALVGMGPADRVDLERLRRVADRNCL